MEAELEKLANHYHDQAQFWFTRAQANEGHGDALLDLIRRDKSVAKIYEGIANALRHVLEGGKVDLK